MSNQAGNIVSFARGADFIHDRAIKQRTENHLPEAVELFRRALELRPENSQYLMELAETFNGMGCFVESVCLLVRLLARGEMTDECYFALGCNFYSMNNLAAAKNALAVYLRNAPEGDYREQALEIIASLTFLERPGQRGRRRKRRARALRRRAVCLMNSGAYRGARSLFRRAERFAPPDAYARALEARVLHKSGEPTDAMRLAQGIHGGTPLARCLNVCTLAELGNSAAVQKRVAPLLKRELEPGAKRMLLEALCVSGLHAEAAKVAAQLLALSPYDRALLHITAAALYNAGGTFAQSLPYWQRALAVEPDDPVAQYYARQSAPTLPIPYRPRLPDEVRAALRARVFEGRATQAEMNWALSTFDAPAQREVIAQLAEMRDFESEMALRCFLIEPDAPASIKLAALYALRTRAVREPILLFNRNGLALQGNVEKRFVSIPDYCYRILWRMADAEAAALSEEWRMLVEAWARVVTRRAYFGRYLRRTEDMAAAILCAVRKDSTPPSRPAQREDTRLRRHLVRMVSSVLREAPTPEPESE